MILKLKQKQEIEKAIYAALSSQEHIDLAKQLFEDWDRMRKIMVESAILFESTYPVHKDGKYLSPEYMEEMRKVIILIRETLGIHERRDLKP